ncbi:hypothetical protein IB642_06120 [Allofrancisella guangzhouensis]|uniref:Uncharacterized protein n=1 Tax=Allofrancisella guangzhouensis TaxID=594679 RepID=A0A0A8E2N6_9GAMM|nr:hypothetical protein [Allofrancisella guangzhouensis]AJC48209.1 hypothetical protein SD28_00290 [Allofrancisella guangzhouensis]MBK2027172.1 hypothetical protein [Allofrancisella guangzhouensis]MBK2044596.1 hypothetical protein [Allofrancisella guangzhouensis]MBK2045986.1 hypothetical protein [Allofrancisella guangzhouensis]
MPISNNQYQEFIQALNDYKLMRFEGTNATLEHRGSDLFNMGISQQNKKEALVKLNHFIKGKNTIFSQNDIQALRNGRLGEIIRKFSKTQNLTVRELLSSEIFKEYHSSNHVNTQPLLINEKKTSSKENQPKTLVFSAHSSYLYDLYDLCEENDIPFQILHRNTSDEVDIWVRDYFFENDNTIYIRNKNSYYANEASFKKGLYTPTKIDYLADMHDVIPGMKNSNRRFLNTHTNNGIQIKSTNRAAEGGNIFCVNNTLGEKYVFLGEQIIRFEKQIATNKKIDKTEDEIILKYKKIFKTNNIIILPNLAYHLDFQMSFIGKGTFLVNSYDINWYETFKPGLFFYLNSHPRSKQLLSDKERKVEEIIDILHKNYFKAEKAFLTMNYKPSSHYGWGGYVEAPKDWALETWNGNYIESSFVNGFDVYSPKKKTNLYVTLDSPHDQHKQYFEELIKKFDIEPYFVNHNGKNAEKTMKYFEEQHGGVRCQTNFLPVEVIEQLEK